GPARWPAGPGSSDGRGRRRRLAPDREPTKRAPPGPTIVRPARAAAAGAARKRSAASPAFPPAPGDPAADRAAALPWQPPARAGPAAAAIHRWRSCLQSRPHPAMRPAAGLPEAGTTPNTAGRDRQRTDDRASCGYRAGKGKAPTKQGRPNACPAFAAAAPGMPGCACHSAGTGAERRRRRVVAPAVAADQDGGHRSATNDQPGVYAGFRIRHPGPALALIGHLVDARLVEPDFAAIVIYGDGGRILVDPHFFSYLQGLARA